MKWRLANRLVIYERLTDLSSAGNSGFTVTKLRFYYCARGGERDHAVSIKPSTIFQQRDINHCYAFLNE